ncbi:MAG: type II secretion system protein GspN, partial [Deltaproteobacteria bacterium]
MKKNLWFKVLGFVGFFIFILFVLFPIDNLRGYIFDKVYSQSGILLVSDSIYLSLFGIPGIGMKNVGITIPVGGQEIDLWSEKVILKPVLAGIFPPIPGGSINITRLKKGGDIYAKVGKGKNLIAFFLEVDDLNLEQIGAKNGNSPLKGKLTISSDIRLNETSMSNSSGFFKITANDLKVSQQTITPPDPTMAAFSFIVPAMKIGRLDGNLSMKNGILEISQFKFGEDPSSDFKGSLTGDFKFENNLEQSALNLILKLKLSQKILDNPDAKTFISFLSSYQTAPGEYGLKWNAQVQDFTNFSIKA